MSPKLSVIIPFYNGEEYVNNVTINELDLQLKEAANKKVTELGVKINPSVDIVKYNNRILKPNNK